MLSASSQRVAAYIDANRIEALTKSAAELAWAIGTSDATVIRTVQALGFSGLPELKRELAMSYGKGFSPADNLKRTLSIIESDIERGISFVLSTHQEGIAHVSSDTVRKAIIEAVNVLKRARNIAIFGIGPTAYLAGYAAALLSRNGRRCQVLQGAGSALADQLLHLSGNQALLVMAYGRAYREVAVTIEEAQKMKLAIVLISDSLEERYARRADVVIPAPRGQTEHVALHATTTACLEALVVGIAAADQRLALSTLEKLNELRGAIAPTPKRST